MLSRMDTKAEMAPGLSLRPMTREELSTLVGWAADEGWNPGVHDAQLFWDTDPGGFIAADHDGELIGGGSITAYGGTFGFMGLFIVRPEWRGRGFGSELWHARLARLHARLEPGATIGMDGVYAMQDWYAKGGFVLSHRDIRFEGRGVAAEPGAGLVPVADVPFAAVTEYDRACFPAPRERFLSGWLRQPDGRAFAAWDGSQLLGYGVARRCGRGVKIGPLFADDLATAEVLFESLAGLRPGEPVYLDVPEINAPALELVARRGMREVFGCARMYVGPAPRLRDDRVLGVTTFELA